MLLNAAETELRLKALRPIRVESAYKAVEFFNSQGYRIIGEELECIFAGVSIVQDITDHGEVLLVNTPQQRARTCGLFSHPQECHDN